MLQGEKNKGQPGGELNMPDSHINWSRSREQVWEELEKRMVEGKSARKVFIPQQVVRYTAAAVIAAMAVLSAVMMLYTKTIEVPAGMHSEIVLADNSVVKLNAESEISYRPLAWIISRSLNLEGEAFFEVTPGRKFTVTSANGETIVLGTSFNIYSRKNDYKVTCVTGKVLVRSSNEKKEIILEKGQGVILGRGEKSGEVTVADIDQTLSWSNNRLSFTSAPLKDVFEEVSRQYNIKIIFPEEAGFLYTGTLVRDTSAEIVLNLICRPYDLEAVRQTEREYAIIKK